MVNQPQTNKTVKTDSTFLGSSKQNNKQKEEMHMRKFLKKRWLGIMPALLVLLVVALVLPGVCLAGSEEITITGVIHEVDRSILEGATVTLLQDEEQKDQATSDSDGSYSLTAPMSGDYEVIASESDFQPETQLLTVEGESIALDFCGQSGLVPNAPDVFCVMSVVGIWQFPENQELPCYRVNVFKVMEVVGAWQFPK